MDDFAIDAHLEQAISAMIIQDNTEGLSAINKPQFFLVVGQPGAGKTELILRIKSLLHNNVLECNADNFRDLHPEIDRIRNDHLTNYSDLTWPAADKWNKDLIEAGLQRNLNIVIETTGRVLQLVLETFKLFKQAGYETNLHVMAVPKVISWVGIRIRYESMLSASNFGREVKDDILDNRCSLLLQNLPEIFESPYLDHVAIFTRIPLLSPTIHGAIRELYKGKKDALPVFLGAYHSKMDLPTKTSFMETCQKILKYMKQRNAPAPEIENFEKLAAENSML